MPGQSLSATHAFLQVEILDSTPVLCLGRILNSKIAIKNIHTHKWEKSGTH